MVVGGILNLLADRQFKQRGTTVKPFEPSSALVTDGIFRYSRNPMYLGMYIFLAGLGIGLGSALPFLVIPVFAVWMNLKFVVPEEEMLARQFGDAYAEYAERVRRWL